MAAVADAIGVRTGNANAFILGFAGAVASIRSSWDLRNGSNNLPYAGKEPGFAPGGFRPELGGNEAANPRHFAGNLWAAQHHGRNRSEMLSYIREYRMAGTPEDHLLSLTAYRMADLLKSGQLTPRAAGDYLRKNVCR